MNGDLHHRRLVWGGHASVPLVAALAVVHGLAVVWLCSSWTRVRLVAFDFREVPNESSMAASPDSLRALGYTEDDPAGLTAFRDIADPIAKGALTDGERLRHLGDYIYALRKSARTDGEHEQREPASRIFARLKNGQPGNCHDMSVVLAAMWRSLGGHVRFVQWTTVDGLLGHEALELYSDSHRRWLYYDMNVNAYFKDDEGTPLSIASVRSNLLTNEDVNLVGNTDPRFHDWTLTDLQSFLQDYPVEWYSLNNAVMAFEPDRRFGSLARFYPILHRIPAPLEAIVDNVTGARDRRLVVEGKVLVGNLLTFQGARLLLAYCVAMLVLCTATLARYQWRRA